MRARIALVTTDVPELLAHEFDLEPLKIDTTELSATCRSRAIVGSATFATPPSITTRALPKHSARIAA